MDREIPNMIPQMNAANPFWGAPPDPRASNAARATPVKWWMMPWTANTTPRISRELDQLKTVPHARAV